MSSPGCEPAQSVRPWVVPPPPPTVLLRRPPAKAAPSPSPAVPRPSPVGTSGHTPCPASCPVRRKRWWRRRRRACWRAPTPPPTSPPPQLQHPRLSDDAVPQQRQRPLRGCQSHTVAACPPCPPPRPCPLHPPLFRLLLHLPARRRRRR